MDKRPETRVSADLPVRIWGMDAAGRPFFQNALAGNLSSEGAQLSQVSHSLKMGEIIGIQYGDKKARFNIMWVKNSVAPGRNEAGVKILAGQTVPWEPVTADAASTKKEKTVSGIEKRRFARHRVNFPLEISFADQQRSHIQCVATDMGGRGCYVESLIPLHIGTKVNIMFWLDSEKVRTQGIVRTSDPGVGMGIEFTTLEMQFQQSLQKYLEKMDQGFAAKSATEGQ
jgi:PilZ domain